MSRIYHADKKAGRKNKKAAKAVQPQPPDDLFNFLPLLD